MLHIFTEMLLTYTGQYKILKWLLDVTKIFTFVFNPARTPPGPNFVDQNVEEQKNYKLNITDVY